MQAMDSASTPDHLRCPANDVETLLARNAELSADNAALRERLDSVEQHLESLKKLLFGPRSEKRPFDIPGQGELFERQRGAETEAPKTALEGYARGRARKGFPEGCVNEEGLRFDDSVPVKHIELMPEGLEGLSPEEYEIIGTDKRYKLAQRAASYTVLCYVQPVIKLKGTEVIVRRCRCRRCSSAASPM